MARFKDCFFGKFVSAEDRYHKQPYRDWRTDFVGQEGLIVLFESEHKAPGKVFFHMLVGVGKWMYCTVGDWEPGGEKDTILTQNSIYTFEGIGATKKWDRLESYGPKFIENIVPGISRDILCYAMQTLRCCAIVGHVHDELIIECPKDTSVDAICEEMGRTPPWAEGLVLRADGYECAFYQKD